MNIFVLLQLIRFCTLLYKMQILKHTYLVIIAYIFLNPSAVLPTTAFYKMFIGTLTFNTILSPFFEVLSDTSTFTINTDLAQSVSSILVVLFSANQLRLAALQVLVAFHPADQTIFQHVWRVFLHTGVFVEDLSGTVRETSLENYGKCLSDLIGSLYNRYMYQ